MYSYLSYSWNDSIVFWIGGCLKSSFLPFVNAFVLLCGKIKIFNHKGFTKDKLRNAKENKIINLLLKQPHLVIIFLIGFSHINIFQNWYVEIVAMMRLKPMCFNLFIPWLKPGAMQLKQGAIDLNAETNRLVRRD